ncbi:MAG: hypothetical protein JWN14_1476 [Chthonomonadales bacterium]|nr:hypothetical protein [Chthonomonadales bacterium]
MSEAESSHQPDDFADTFGEPIRHVLDITTWNDGHDLATLYDKLNQMVAESIAQDNRTRESIRQLILPRLRDGSDRFAPPNAGLYKITPKQIAEIHRGLLFNGATECCDGTVAAHDSLLLTVVQIGISLVAYQGGQGTWVQRLYRRDLHAQHPDPMEEAMALLARRSKADDTGDDDESSPLNSLMRRTLMEYAERAALTNLSSALWRMGHGSPVPTGMLLVTGPGTKDLLNAGMATLRKLLLEHKRFVYVVSEPADRFLLTLGNALHPLEFAVTETLGRQFERLQLVQSRRAGAERSEVVAFMQEVGPEVVTGVYRAGLHAPPRVFYAHRDFACEAAALAIADSVLQPYRGFPMLIDLADILCGNVFDQASFKGTIQNAYARAGEPMRYLGERETRA